MRIAILYQSGYWHVGYRFNRNSPNNGQVVIMNRRHVDSLPDSPPADVLRAAETAVNSNCSN